VGEIVTRSDCVICSATTSTETPGVSSDMPAIEAAAAPAGAGRRRLAWRQAEVIERIAETPRATTLVLDVPGWPGHLAGQHVDIRLTADDGYQTQVRAVPRRMRWKAATVRFPR
jgi:hypothetical protein